MATIQKKSGFLRTRVLVGIMLVIVFGLAGVFYLVRHIVPATTVYTTSHVTFWSVQSIDTAKYSRDRAREKLGDLSFDAIIDTQVRNIASTGATHISINTPYDAEFLPYLKRWVSAARRHGLKVWFRGNWSGWEGWFNYPRIDRATHIARTKQFILDNPKLFEDGDIFTPCPECENGGPGDPRHNNDVAGHRAFLIQEYTATKDAFGSIGKNVLSNYDSMNGDVARLVMDSETTRALGGIVTIDHYVNTPARLARDVAEIAKASGGRVVLGEFGVPIPDIQGSLTAAQQASWVESALGELAKVPDLIGVNYWVNVGGSTEIWNSQNIARPAVGVISNFYNPRRAYGFVKDELDRPIEGAHVIGEFRSAVADAYGYFELPYYPKANSEIRFSAPGFGDATKNISGSDVQFEITLVKTNKGILDRFLEFIRSL
jgi:hypothetical protein